jgi:hypothetical protein
MFKFIGLGVWAVFFMSGAYAAPLVVGHISFVKGSNMAQLLDQPPRILGKESEIYQGDNIQTTVQSFVMVDFTDGTKVTVRPNSNFSIDHYDTLSKNKSAQLVLHQGEVNASMGDIAKQNPDKFQIKTETATVKPKSENAEFNVSICDKACEEKASVTIKKTEQSVVARVVELKGNVIATSRNDKVPQERVLSLGMPLYNADVLRSEVNSYVLMVFPDGQKLTLQPQSELDIKQYFYQIQDKKDKVLLSLVKGGLRALTGSVGKSDHSAYTLETPVAIIGVRGTLTYTMINPDLTFEHRTEQGLSIVHNNQGEWEVSEGSRLMNSDLNVIPIITITPPNATQPLGSMLQKNDSETKNLFVHKSSVNGDTIIHSTKGTTSVENNKGGGVELKPGETGGVKSGGEPTVISDQNDSSGSSRSTPSSGGISEPIKTTPITISTNPTEGC